jgi:hypothetical protein
VGIGVSVGLTIAGNGVFQIGDGIGTLVERIISEPGQESDSFPNLPNYEEGESEINAELRRVNMFQEIGRYIGNHEFGALLAILFMFAINNGKIYEKIVQSKRSFNLVFILFFISYIMEVLFLIFAND